MRQDENPFLFRHFRFYFFSLFSFFFSFSFDEKRKGEIGCWQRALSARVSSTRFSFWTRFPLLEKRCPTNVRNGRCTSEGERKNLIDRIWEISKKWKQRFLRKIVNLQFVFLAKYSYLSMICSIHNRLLILFSK